MRSIFCVGWFVTSLMVVGCADLLGIEPWQDPAGAGKDDDKSEDSGDSGGGNTDAGTCGNGVQDGAETGVDCGGIECKPCPDGFGCNQDADCQSYFCPPTRGYCVLNDGREVCGVVNPGGNTCADCMLGSGETDVDCGGVCGPCRAGKVCQNGGDCLSGTCTGICSLGEKGTTCYTNDDCASNTCGSAGCTSGSCCQ